VIDGEGTLCCHFGGDAGARAAASAALSPALTSVPAIAPRSSRSLMMALRQSSLIFVVVRGLKAAAWVMELFALEAAFAGGIADSEPIKAVAVTAATVILVRRIVSPRG